MLRKAKEKLHQHQSLKPLSQKDDIKYRELIENFKKSVKLWFINGADDETRYGEIQATCIQILLHGLHDSREMLEINKRNVNSRHESSTSSITTTKSCESTNTYLELCVLLKRLDDFEWILNAVNIRSGLNNTNYSTDNESPLPPTSLHCSDDDDGAFTMSSTSAASHNKNNAEFLNRHHQLEIHNNTSSLKLWLKKKLHNSSILSNFLRYLVSDSELLNEHYTSAAFLKQQKYVNALLIGLSALETFQYGLLTQIDSILKESDKLELRHKRSNSDPNVVILPIITKRKGRSVDCPMPLMINSLTPVLPTIRKTKSLPRFQQDEFYEFKNPRRKLKTIVAVRQRLITKLQNIPWVELNLEIQPPYTLVTSSGSSSFDDDEKPSTSHHNFAKNRNNPSPMSSSHLSSTASITSASTSSSACSSSLNSTPRNIQIINTDHIKVWTGQSLKTQTKEKASTTPCQVIPKSNSFTAKSSSSQRSSKSVSPLNSFFSSLFNTPPSYTSWYTDHSAQEDNEVPETAVDTITPADKSSNRKSTTPAPPPTLQQSSNASSTVFENFFPTYGKKLHAGNLFDDIDFDNTLLSNTSTLEDAPACSNLSSSTPTKNSQSLTKFLQMSNVYNTIGNTELEKENAHFRISEAIISAIEFVKWNNLATCGGSQGQETPLATDCLSSVSRRPPLKTNDCIKGGEHVPFAKDVCCDQLSAEVVGLSLISKFDEKHLPKVSALKWLISDGETPQKLLPMPDLTSSENPDDHVVHSVTRGTKYWAPPRQQIIFFDHPTPIRKELLKKQNFRCAGCGMRVSAQYVHSFRYCTYLGKYHCTGCHRNQMSPIPAKILQAWDFKCYPVSAFAYRMLQQISTTPLFYIPYINFALYSRSISLLNARKKRLELKFVKDFICTCRFAVREQFYFDTVPDYITSDIDNWSMADFIDAQSNSLHRSIDNLIGKCKVHIYYCVLCIARGFLCEHCRADTVIYPWDSNVERCDRCGSCFHRKCWKSISQLCYRCRRMDERQEFGKIHN